MNMSSWWEKGMVDVKDGAFRAALSFASLTPWISSPHLQWQCHCAGRATFHFTSTQLPLFLLAFLASLSLPSLSFFLYYLLLYCSAQQGHGDVVFAQAQLLCYSEAQEKKGCVKTCLTFQG
jgi:hypothetical protein